MIQLINGDCLEEMKKMEDNSVDSIVTDPPYGLSFMGKKWDYDVPSEDVWRECLRVLKPGGHLLSFAGTRTQHRMAVRIEDAGFEIRDMIAWVYGSGFPKSLNIGKAVDKLQGNEREELGDMKPAGFKTAASGYTDNKAWSGKVTKGTSPWEGWGTALKPALEPITVARKPLIGTVAENVLTHGTGGLNIDGCRVAGEMGKDRALSTPRRTDNDKYGKANETINPQSPLGRFPANLIHDGSEEVVGLFPETKSGGKKKGQEGNPDGLFKFGGNVNNEFEPSSGSAARFFYCAKASKKDRNEGLEGFEDKEYKMNSTPKRQFIDGVQQAVDFTTKPLTNKNPHPTVKPTDLMRYLCRLVTPKGGTVLDPFMGSGSTGKAAKLEGFNFIGIEMDSSYYDIAVARIT